MTGFELRTSNVGSGRSTNWATTTTKYQVFSERLQGKFVLWYLITFASVHTSEKTESVQRNITLTKEHLKAKKYFCLAAIG